MTLTQLSYIIAVDSYRHFATAAEKCYVTQPTLSMQIQKLEDELGVLIFDRSKHPVVPTRLGERIIEQARIIVRESEQIRTIANEDEDELTGTFRIGILPTIAPYLIPLFLRNFAEQYPHVQLTFEEELTANLMQQLNRDQIDLAIIATPANKGNIYEETLYHEPFVGYISKNHELTKRPHLSVDDLDAGKIWLLNEGHCFRDQAVKLCRKGSAKQNDEQISFESGNLETLKKLVEQDFGLTLLPYLAIHNMDDKPSKAVIKPFVEPMPQRTIRLVYSRKYLQKNIVKALSETILDSIPDVLRNSEPRLVIE